MKVKSIFFSDVHLGISTSNVSYLLDELKKYDMENIFMVGDIIDGWRLKKNWKWNQNCNDFLQKILRYGRKGVNVYYITGNHDDFLRDYTPFEFGNNIKIVDEYIYNDIWIVHGDQFDGLVKLNPFLYYLGDKAYDFSQFVNKNLNMIRKTFGYDYWSFSGYCKEKVKHAVNYINGFEELVSEATKEKQCKKVICGHIHHPIIKNINGITYYNCGDWVDNKSYIIEYLDGTLELKIL